MPAPTASLDPAQSVRDSIDALARQIFFVVGCQKSGTTWLGEMLNGHPEVVCRGEGKLAFGLRHLLAQAVSVHNQNQIVGPDGALGEPELDALFRTAAGMMMARWIRERPRTRAIGEKTPEHALALGVLDRAFPGCRVIHIIRDGRDGVVSGWFHNLHRGRPDFRQKFPDMATYARYFAQHHWAAYISAARAFGAAHPDRYREVRYEALKQDPAKELAPILEFLGVDASARSVAKAVEFGSFERMSGGRQAGQEDSKSHIRKGVVGDWRNHLDGAALAAFMGPAAGLMQELGYRKDVPLGAVAA